MVDKRGNQGRASQGPNKEQQIVREKSYRHRATGRNGASGKRVGRRKSISNLEKTREGKSSLGKKGSPAPGRKIRGTRGGGAGGKNDAPEKRKTPEKIGEKKSARCVVIMTTT